MTARAVPAGPWLAQRARVPLGCCRSGRALLAARGGDRRSARARLHPGGVFALWSDDPPDEDFLDLLRQVFATAGAQVVPFPNHHTGTTSSNTVYVATAPSP